MKIQEEDLNEQKDDEIWIGNGIKKEKGIGEGN